MKILLFYQIKRIEDWLHEAITKPAPSWSGSLPLSILGPMACAGHRESHTVLCNVLFPSRHPVAHPRAAHISRSTCWGEGRSMSPGCSPPTRTNVASQARGLQRRRRFHVESCGMCKAKNETAQGSMILLGYSSWTWYE